MKTISKIFLIIALGLLTACDVNSEFDAISGSASLVGSDDKGLADTDNDGVVDEGIPSGLNEPIEKQAEEDNESEESSIGNETENLIVGADEEIFDPPSDNVGADIIVEDTSGDTDTDGVPDAVDAFPLDSSETLDTDSNGIGNNADTDDDGDGVDDAVDAFPLDSSETLDTDSDGIGNNADTDADGDGVLDVDDNTYPLISLGDRTDTDGDGIPNECDSDCIALGMAADTDDDGDGVDDVDELFDLDQHLNGVVTIQINNVEGATPKQGDPLTADRGDGKYVIGGSWSYQWYYVENLTDDEIEIEKATEQTYILTQNEVGYRIKVKVTYTDEQGTEDTVDKGLTDLVVNVNDSPSGKPVIQDEDGDAITIPKQGDELTANTDAITDDDGIGSDAWSYKWYRVDGQGESLIGTDDQTYKLIEQDVGKTIKVSVAYTDNQGTEERSSDHVSLDSDQTAVVMPVNTNLNLEDLGERFFCNQW